MSKRSVSPSRQSTKKRKYASTFKASWIGDLSWIGKSDRGTSYAYCRVCNSHFGVSAGGRNDAVRHGSTATHVALSKVASTSQPVTSFFVKNDDSAKRLITAEVMFANMIAEHNLSFLVADHFTKLIREMFPDCQEAKKFLCGRMKTTMIVKNAIAPELDKRVVDCCRRNRFSILTDESNDTSSSKNLVILVRYVPYDNTFLQN